MVKLKNCLRRHELMSLWNNFKDPSGLSAVGNLAGCQWLISFPFVPCRQTALHLLCLQLRRFLESLRLGLCKIVGGWWACLIIPYNIYRNKSYNKWVTWMLLARLSRLAASSHSSTHKRLLPQRSKQICRLFKVMLVALLNKCNTKETRNDISN